MDSGYFTWTSFVIGAFLTGLAVRNALRGYASRGWPHVPGWIIRSFVRVDTDSEGGVSYTPQVEYEYNVAGTPYRGTELRYGQTGYSTREGAERAIGACTPGASVPVFFNPRRPATAVLVPTRSRRNVLIAGAGLVFLACALALFRQTR